MSATSKKPLLGVCVLVVDDDRDTRELFTLILQEAGAEACAAVDAKDGLIRTFDWTPTVVLCDLAMPAIDGYSFVQMLHSIRGLKRLPAIAVSGLAAQTARDNALAAGFCDYVVKPVMPDDLIALVERWAFQRAPGAST